MVWKKIRASHDPTKQERGGAVPKNVLEREGGGYLRRVEEGSIRFVDVHVNQSKYRRARFQQATRVL